MTEKTKQNRRGKGEGSICQRANGLWMARIGVGRDATGKRLTKTFYGKTKKEVADKLTGEASALLTGTSVTSGKMTVADLLTKWYEESAKPNTSPGTAAEYKRIVDSHIVPKIGSVKLSALRPLHIQTMLSALEKDGKGARTRQYCYVTLHRAFVIAMRWQLLSRNPCDGVDPPKVTKRRVTPLTPEQAKNLLAISQTNRFHAVYVLALTTGMRQGELFGLQWDDINLKDGILQVRHSLENVNNKLRLKEPKSESGKRQIALPEMAVKALWDHKAKQLAEGLAGCPHVFPDSDGGLLRRSNFLKWSWFKIRIAAKLEGVHFHDLRHSCASLMLADGVQMKAIQAILGHSTISMTMDTYAHLMPDSQRIAASTFDRLLG
ncbi:MAG: site-specific integrase [Planctomycetaceae bacterium]